MKLQYIVYGVFICTLVVGSLGMMTSTAQAMNKAELIEAMASRSGLSTPDSKKALEGFVSASADALKKGDRIKSVKKGGGTKVLKKGDRISLIGFGSFSVSRRAAQNDSRIAVDFFPEVRSTGAENRHKGEVVTGEELEAQIFEKCKASGEDKCPENVEGFVDSLIAVTLEQLAQGESVEWGDFGTFESAAAQSVSKRSARTGRNPQTGKEIQIAVKNTVKFKAGAELSK